jgi:hypothetical protein
MEEQVLKIITESQSKYTIDEFRTGIITNKKMAKEITSMVFEFIEWKYPKYSKYWGSDLPNKGKWYECNTILSKRRYFTTDELFQYWWDNVKNK